MAGRFKLNHYQSAAYNSRVSSRRTPASAPKVPQASFWQETFGPAPAKARGLREERDGGDRGDQADHHGPRTAL